MIYGYARVSSKEQSLERQIKILKDEIKQNGDLKVIISE
mgnify:CR=1 FL=1